MHVTVIVTAIVAVRLMRGGTRCGRICRVAVAVLQHIVDNAVHKSSGFDCSKQLSRSRAVHLIHLQPGSMQLSIITVVIIIENSRNHSTRRTQQQQPVAYWH